MATSMGGAFKSMHALRLPLCAVKRAQFLKLTLVILIGHSNLIGSLKSCALLKCNRAIILLSTVDHNHLPFGCRHLYHHFLNPQDLSFDPHVYAPHLTLAHILIALLTPSVFTGRAVKVMVLYLRVSLTYRAVIAAPLFLFLIYVLHR